MARIQEEADSGGAKAEATGGVRVSAMDVPCVLMETFCVSFLLVTPAHNFARWSPTGKTEETLRGGLYINYILQLHRNLQ